MERTNSKSNGELIEIVMGDTKPGSLSEAFKNRKKNLVDKIENRDKAE